MPLTSISTDQRIIRMPGAATVSRLLAGMGDLGLYRARRADEGGFRVRGIPDQDRADHGGLVVVWWSEPSGELTPDARRTIERGRHTLIRGVLEHADYAVFTHHRGHLVLLTPDDARAHQEAHHHAGELLGHAAEFHRTTAGGLPKGARGAKVSRAYAMAEIALALRDPGRTVQHDENTGMVTVEHADTLVSLTALNDHTQQLPLPAVSEACQLLRGAGETLLDDHEAMRGTGVWVRSSRIPGEVLLLRMDDGKRTDSHGRPQYLWMRRMGWYRDLLEDSGWTMTGNGNLGWSFYRPGCEPIPERAAKTLAAVFPRSWPGGTSGWRIDGWEGTRTLSVRWVSIIEDEQRRATAETAMLPYLADALRRVGLSTTLPDELPHLSDEPPYRPAVYFAEPPIRRSQPRYRAWEHLGGWWVDDTDTGFLARQAHDQDNAKHLAAILNRDAETRRRHGRVTDHLPGMTGSIKDLPEFRAIAADLAAAGCMPAYRWNSADHSRWGFTLTLQGPALTVNHLGEGPSTTRPEQTDAAQAFDAALLAYQAALDVPGRIVSLDGDGVTVWGAEADQRPVPPIPAGDLFDAAVTYRLDHGQARTEAVRLSQWAVDPYGDGVASRHRVAEHLAAGGDVMRYVVDDVRPFAALGTRQHADQMKATALLSKALPGSVWAVSVLETVDGYEGAMLLAVPEDAPGGHVGQLTAIFKAEGWSPARLSKRTVWVRVPAAEDE